MKAGLPKPKAVILTYPLADNNQMWVEPMSAFEEGVSAEDKAVIDEFMKEQVSTEYSIQYVAISLLLVAATRLK